MKKEKFESMKNKEHFHHFKIRYIILMLIFSSCSNSFTLEHFINEGDMDIWVISDYFYHDEKQEVIYDYYFSVNAITFRTSNECSVPIVYKDGWGIEDSKGKWYLNEDSMKLNIISNNDFLNGTYLVCVIDNEVPQSLVLKSDSVKIVLKKSQNPSRYKVKKNWKCN